MLTQEKFKPLSFTEESKQILNSVPGLINKTFPIPGRFRSALPSDIAELSQLLTNNRGERSLSYLGRPNYLSAYLHYFLPWNLYRLCLLLPTLNIKLSADDTITDFGCGPLTFTSALWITRPDLRKIPLRFNCVDRSSPVLEAGKKFFNGISGGMDANNLWKINLIKKDINLHKIDNDVQRKSSLVCSINIFNEMYERIPHSNIEGLQRMAANAALFMHNNAEKNASILTVEPGIPQSGKFISLLRDEFIKLGRSPAAPCTHVSSCPLIPRTKQKERWCHFAHDTIDAPKELKRLSIAAKLPKDRLVFSYLLTGETTLSSPAENVDVRVISDAFPLPDNYFGRYGCSALGLVLLSGEGNYIENITSGSFITVNITAKGQRDKKSGALIVLLPQKNRSIK
jgi:ribosomal protein RSM22 (predicted rRNA methylase)